MTTSATITAYKWLESLLLLRNFEVNQGNYYIEYYRANGKLGTLFFCRVWDPVINWGVALGDPSELTEHKFSIRITAELQWISKHLKALLPYEPVTCFRFIAELPKLANIPISAEIFGLSQNGKFTRETGSFGRNPLFGAQAMDNADALFHRLTSSNYTPSEWEWFTVQLRLGATTCAKLHSVTFEIVSPVDLRCHILHVVDAVTVDEIGYEAHKYEHLVRAWVSTVRDTIDHLLIGLPNLRDGFNHMDAISYHVRFHLEGLRGNMCTLRGHEINWGG
ncbi:MAG: hypothetical protein ACR2IE_10015 [Candidatus Sumerlaeaceae bacterium]